MFTIMKKSCSTAMFFENPSDIRNNMTRRFFETNVVSSLEFSNVIPRRGRPKMYALKICLKLLSKENEQFIQKVTFQPLMDFK